MLTEKAYHIQIHLKLHWVQSHRDPTKGHQQSLSMMKVVDVCTIVEKHLCYLQTDVLILVNVLGFCHPREGIEHGSVPHRVMMIHVGPILGEQFYYFIIASHASRT